MKRRSFLWCIPPLQGLAESLLLGLFILAATAQLEGYVDPFVFQVAAFFLCGCCGMWPVLRIRLPQGDWRRQLAWEMGVGLGLSLMMVAALTAAGDALGWNVIWRLNNWDRAAYDALLICTGAGYVLTRGGVRLWQRWNVLRRQRLLWSLTHAQLTVVVFFDFLAALIFFFITPYSRTAYDIWTQTSNPVAAFVTGLLVSLFPALMLVTLITGISLAVMLPPLAVLSYFVARRTTRRLETLAGAAAALRAGDYSARTPVEGEDEVAHLQADFNAMAEKLSQALADLKRERDTVAEVLQSRRDLVANVSHELRTPVATLRASIETTLDQWENLPPSETRQKLAVMEGEIQRLSGLMDDLFVLSRADVGQLPLTLAAVAVGPLVTQAVNALAPLAWQTGRVTVTAELPENLPTVLADSRRLQQVVVNLLRNAVRYTPPGGLVVVLAAVENGLMRIEVRDTGEGISPEDLPHIWERFYRGENAGTENAGLGLALVKELVEAMGGQAAVESIPGRGSCFSLTLPLNE